MVTEREGKRKGSEENRMEHEMTHLGGKGGSSKSRSTMGGLARFWRDEVHIEGVILGRRG